MRRKNENKIFIFPQFFKGICAGFLTRRQTRRQKFAKKLFSPIFLYKSEFLKISILLAPFTLFFNKSIFSTIFSTNFHFYCFSTEFYFFIIYHFYKVSLPVWPISEEYWSRSSAGANQKRLDENDSAQIRKNYKTFTKLF